MTRINLDEQLCRQCGGRCCQGHSGLWCDPQRFFAIFAAAKIPPAEQLSRILQRVNLCLRDLGGVLVPAPITTEQGCRFRSASGCSFSLKERPCQCLALTPNLETLLADEIHCRLPADYGSNTARENWRPFQKLLRQANPG